MGSQQGTEKVCIYRCSRAKLIKCSSAELAVRLMVSQCLVALPGTVDKAAVHSTAEE